MIVSKEDFKRLQKDGGKTVFLCVAKFVSGLSDLSINAIGNISVRNNGVYFDVILGKKVFIPMDCLESVEVRNKNLEFIVKHHDEKKSIRFSVDKIKDLNKLCDAIISQENSLSIINKADEDDELRCPKCNSKHLDVQKKGFGVGKAAVGVLTVGAYGLLAGGIGKNKLQLTCLKCGHKFKPGQA